MTGAAGDALAAAADEARKLGHHYVRPEHLLLGLLSVPEEMAAIALAEHGISREVVREHVIERYGTAEPRPTGSLGVAPQTKRLLELARAIGKSLCHQCPRTEHMLLAAVSPKLDSPAASLLAECLVRPGADPRGGNADGARAVAGARRRAQPPVVALEAHEQTPLATIAVNLDSRRARETKWT